jgi:predicted 2-oxoglutarate/Fe(II)-dependent dioxygenase YbiX
VEVPKDIQGGELILANRNRSVACIRPHTNTLILFQGDLTHSINPVTCSGIRLSLVCEQYRLDAEELQEIPEIQIESRTLKPEKKKKKDKLATIQ